MIASLTYYGTDLPHPVMTTQIGRRCVEIPDSPLGRF